MLTHLHIRNFAIIDQVEIELLDGMTVLTGETGAGKSILLDALGLVLGDRADSAQVRDGSDKADINAIFSVEGNTAAKQWLSENEFEDDDCIIRRTISKDGRSRGYINGQVAPLQSLRDLGETLVDIHGQHEHQMLTRKSTQRELLDDYADNGKLRAELVDVYGKLHAVSTQLEGIGDNDDAESQADMLQYQLDELNALNLESAYIASLDGEHKRLSNAGRLLSDCQQVLDALYESDRAVHGQIARMQETLAGLANLDQVLAPMAETLNDAAIQCSEAAADLRDYVAKIDVDENRLVEIEQTLTALHDLSRKHKTQPEQLSETRTAIAQRLEGLANVDRDRKVLEKRLTQLQEQYRATDTKLGQTRRAAALELGEEISAHMQELGMVGGRFSVLVGTADNAKPSRHGSDSITFMVSANPGQSPQPLSKVASGGELSRISLALQLVASKYKSSATLIFDEVDSGIGGGVAETVGRQLRKLSARAQVMCVTHLPQVASQGTSHFVVSKSSDDESTKTEIRMLNDKEKIEEVARMLGGVDITEQSRSHAQEMLTNAG